MKTLNNISINMDKAKAIKRLLKTVKSPEARDYALYLNNVMRAKNGFKGSKNIHKPRKKAFDVNSIEDIL